MRRGFFAVIAISILGALVIIFGNSPAPEPVRFLRFVTNAQGTLEAQFKFIRKDYRLIQVDHVEQKILGNWMLEQSAPSNSIIFPDVLNVTLPGFDHPRRVVFVIWDRTWRNRLVEIWNSVSANRRGNSGWSAQLYLTNELPAFPSSHGDGK
jgi:hypothetical protein